MIQEVSATCQVECLPTTEHPRKDTWLAPCECEAAAVPRLARGIRAPTARADRLRKSMAAGRGPAAIRALAGAFCRYRNHAACRLLAWNRSSAVRAAKPSVSGVTRQSLRSGPTRKRWHVLAPFAWRPQTRTQALLSHRQPRLPLWQAMITEWPRRARAALSPRRLGHGYRARPWQPSRPQSCRRKSGLRAHRPDLSRWRPGNTAAHHLYPPPRTARVTSPHHEPNWKSSTNIRIAVQGHNE